MPGQTKKKIKITEVNTSFIIIIFPFLSAENDVFRFVVVVVAYCSLAISTLDPITRRITYSLRLGGEKKNVTDR